VNRYLVVISLGLEAMSTGDGLDYARFYQQQSDVCMLRLFDSFLESAPQLVFHLYVMIVGHINENETWNTVQEQQHLDWTGQQQLPPVEPQTWASWTVERISWTAISALASMISLGWGIAAYSSAMRMVRAEKSKMTWTGMILQTIWRFGMLSARITALVLLTLTVHEWVFIIMCESFFKTRSFKG